MSSVSISFDEECRIRVLEGEDFAKSKELQQESSNFTSSTFSAKSTPRISLRETTREPKPEQTTELNAFNNTVTQLSNALSERSESIDKMKLQAIGQRNIYESARAERKRKRTELANLIKEKLRELDRQNAQLDSLVQVEREQQALIEKLTSSD